MNDPSRWLDDTETPAELRELLAGAERPRALDETTRARLGARVGRLAVPVTIATWLSVKSAAAIGVAAGLVSAGTGLGISAYVEHQAEKAEPAKVATSGTRKLARRAAEQPQAPASASSTPDLPRPSHERAATPASAPAPTRSGGLAEESVLLERARRSLSSEPAHALALAREHAASFPQAQLASERSLVELEALYRLGRENEARALGQRLLASAGDDLYRARIERLLQRVDGGR